MIKKNIKIILLIISTILIAIAIFQISHTYSVFYSKLTGTSQIQIGKWDILVNNADVTSDYETDFTMDSLNFSINPRVLDGRIAPGMYGTGEISIKPVDVDVSFRYDIFVDRSVIENEEIEIADLIVKNKTKNLILTDVDTYTGVVLLTDIVTGFEDLIELRVEWTNDEDNNEQDTLLGMNPVTNIMIPISIRFSQYLGETINAI